MCVHTTVLCEICRSNSSVDIDSSLAGYSMCIEIYISAFRRGLMILSVGQSTVSCMYQSTWWRVPSTYCCPVFIFHFACTKIAVQAVLFLWQACSFLFSVYRLLLSVADIVVDSLLKHNLQWSFLTQSWSQLPQTKDCVAEPSRTVKA